MKYSCDSYIDSYEYGKMALYFPRKMWFMFSLYGTLYNIILSILIFFLTKNMIDAIGFFLIIEIVILILFRVKINYIAKLVFKFYLKNKIECNFKLKFYDDYFIRSGKTDLEEKYEDITKCIETDSNFYLYDASKDIIFIIEKNECEIELVNFIRNKFNNLDSRLGGNIIFKNRK